MHKIDFFSVGIIAFHWLQWFHELFSLSFFDPFAHDASFLAFLA
jgi:hypothetical protein